MFIFDNPIKPRTPEEQEVLNRTFLRKKHLEYVEFCKRFLKSIDTENISIEYMDDENLTQGFTVVNFLLEYISERGFYYNQKFVITTWHLKNIGNPIFEIYREFFKSCREKDPFRI